MTANNNSEFRNLLEYKTASLQDCIDDTGQEMRECRELSKRQASEILLLRQSISSLQAEKESLYAQVQYRDEYLEKHNIVLPFIGPDGELVEIKARNFADLLKDKEDELEGMLPINCLYCTYILLYIVRSSSPGYFPLESNLNKPDLFVYF